LNGAEPRPRRFEGETIMGKRVAQIIHKALHVAALIFLVYAFAQALPLDLMAVAFAGDVLTYFEIAAAVWLVAQVTRLKGAAAYAGYVVQRTLRRARVRARRAARRVKRLPAPSFDEEGRGAFAFA